MKLVSLNTWGGRLRESIDEFVKRHADDTDIFCFQEVYVDDTKEADPQAGERPDFFKELQDLLPDFVGIFAEQVTGTGLATFVRNLLAIESADSHFILSGDELSHLQMPNGARYYPRIVQTVILRNPNIAIYNFHGVPGSGKRDTTERELQMQRLHQVLGKFKGDKVLVGDFNLSPDTEAIHGLEKIMRNLVIEGGFKTTRTAHYDKREALPFADYTFVTPGIKVVKFDVLIDEVSDHSPMSLEFDPS
jgi:endonuclease/exonuclease/phosphatase family metal-dependent hydrolase